MDGSPNGGVFSPQNLGLYTYTANNPVNLVDPDGKFFWYVVGAIVAANDAYNNYQEGGWTAVGKGLAKDALITVATGGAGKLAGKVAGKMYRAVKTTEKVGWAGNAFERGRKAESLLLKKIGAKPMKASNYPVIDSITGGIARSIKSINLNAKTYQNASKLRSTLKGYVNKLDKFTGKRWGGNNVELFDMKGKALDIAVPKGMSSAQRKVFSEITSYAKQKGIKVTIHTLD